MQVRLEGGSSLSVRAKNLQKRSLSTARMDGVDSLRVHTLVLGPRCIHVRVRMCRHEHTYAYLHIHRLWSA